MIILITGASHTGKTLLAQRLLERIHFPYLSIDHLKMGLIRDGQTHLTPSDDKELTPYLWGIVKEMVKTAIENNQNMIVEGCYIPFDWKKDFSQEYLRDIRYICLVMSENYIRNHFADIRDRASVIEERLEDSDFTVEGAIMENSGYLQGCRQYGCTYHEIDDRYDVDDLWCERFCRENGII